DIPEERFIFMGNTSLQGACLYLLSRQARQTARELVSRMTPLELSLEPGYMEEYLRALFIPHTDLNLFPSVKR
ncbi:MAG: ATP-binding protein, partial [Candidatus Omnitrophica bacterium]|nr:ATP-binding protein [Candidatus Omnitrophota bacterium]